MAKMDPHSKAGRFLIALRTQYPNDSTEELFARFSEAVSNDQSLERAVADEAFRGIMSDLYDQAERTPPRDTGALKKPS